MGRTPRLGSHSVMSSLVVFMKGWWEGGGMGLDGEDTQVRVSHSAVSSLVVFMKGW